MAGWYETSPRLGGHGCAATGLVGRRGGATYGMGNTGGQRGKISPHRSPACLPPSGRLAKEGR